MFQQSRASREAPSGAVLAFVNACSHERSNHAIRTIQTVGEVFRRGFDHSKQLVNSALHSGGREKPSAAAESSAHVRSASITRSTSDGLAHFFQGFWACPNGSRFAAIASDAGQRLREVVYANGQLALSGAKLDTRRRARLPDTQVRAIFDDMDRNGNGYIDAEEFHQLIQRLGLPASDTFLRCLTQSPRTHMACHISDTFPPLSHLCGS